MLRRLPDYTLYSGCHNSSQRRLDTILVNGLSAFCWQERLAGQELGESVFQVTYEAIERRLMQASTTFGALVVVTNRDSPGGASSSVSKEAVEPPVFRSHLRAAFSKFVVVKLAVMRDATASFQRSFPISEALEERGKGEGVNKFTGWVDVVGLGIQLQESPGIRDGIFRFRTSQSGSAFAS